MGNPRPVFAAEVEGLGSFRPLGESGAAGRLRRAIGDVDWLCWRREALEGLDPGTGCATRYRLSRNRAGRMEAEVLDARPSERENVVRGPVLHSGLPMEHAAP